MRRSDICIYLGPADRAELKALITKRNTPRKLVWRAEIALATADERQDVVIANPPFGKVKNLDGPGNTEWMLEGKSVTTSDIDHAISMRALSGMRDDGSAVLILGGH